MLIPEEVSDDLLNNLAISENNVGLRYCQGEKFSEKAECFPSVRAAEARIKQLFLDQTVTRLWIGTPDNFEGELIQLLGEVNEQGGVEMGLGSWGPIFIWHITF